MHARRRGGVHAYARSRAISAMGTSDAQPLPYEEEEERLGRSKAMVAGEGVEQDEAAKAAIE